MGVPLIFLVFAQSAGGNHGAFTTIVSVKVCSLKPNAVYCSI